MASTKLEVEFKDVVEAHKRISPFIHKTPIFTSKTLNETTGRNVFFKAENLQKTGSFKARGALNAVMKFKEEELDFDGVITNSCGNHGQGLAWAAKQSGVPCSVVIPSNTCSAKKHAILGHGAELIECGPLSIDRVNMCYELGKEKNYQYIGSSDHRDVLAGQGTLALEFLKQVPELDAILVPVCGGGMIAGVAVVAKHLKSDIKVFAVEPEGKNLEKCLRAAERLWPYPPQNVNTIADAIRRQTVSNFSWPFVLQHVEKDVLTVNDTEIIRALQFVFQRMKLVIEGASGASVAAVMSDKMRKMDSSLQNIGVILCGGNIDIYNLPWCQYINHNGTQT